jgi:hypothetical protein
MNYLTFTDKESLIHHINKLRKLNKHRWFTVYCMLNQTIIHAHIYNTWIQRLSCGTIIDGSSMGLSVKQFNAWLIDNIKED